MNRDSPRKALGVVIILFAAVAAALVSLFTNPKQLLKVPAETRDIFRQFKEIVA